MQNEKVEEFLENKKQDFLKKKINSNTTDEDKVLFQEEAMTKYSLDSWLVDASKRAGQLFVTSHPAKFIHPNAKSTNIIADCKQANDGLLRTSNVSVLRDVFGNAAALDVEKFLRIQIEDKTILEHLEQNTPTIQSIFSVKDVDFGAIRENFLQIRKSNAKQTSGKLKQVYFPIDGDYHLLTPLVPSGIVFELKKRINDIRSSETNKEVREARKKIIPIKGEINDIPNLTSIKYGGTKPQNISTLNNQNGGVSFLLSSMPPVLEKRKVQPPKSDFFKNCLWVKLFQTDFEIFHSILQPEKGNNKAIRDSRDDVVVNAVFKLRRLVRTIRKIQEGWSNTDTYKDLSNWQKIWLDNQYSTIRNDKKKNEDYVEKAYSAFATWFIGAYKQAIANNKTLGTHDINHIKKVLKQERELFI